ncbi:E3 ubiquitin-protein ligase TRIM9 isoform X1 [Sitodiplosis mosellana]|uniref:E3 ubiquitin-protein ligase TRIM9 isoform X1 n=1 Tax=Sitodiplosis mosellana TaxID=263140 RepID=UPI0024442CC5|nr:E3 ubiquitin-protein ligase TRIM9 isoform X1 [Sitodiplosis mosellana]XP_055300879.1 E3 ubiquitin-protein ligase TRIM9 isoform X1 [Sitodiplosis mosellana]
MEEELRCPLCKGIYVNPVLLPCYHGLCLTCALDTQVQIANNNDSCSTNSSTIVTTQVPASHQNPSAAHISTLPRNNSGESTANSSASESISSDQEADKVSILSEADSGVICTSRPSSYAGTPNFQALLFPPSGGAVYSLACPICRKIVFFDDGGARNLPPYRTMESIINRFGERETLRCQMCEIEPKIATVVCEQCQIRYCDSCRELCHPARGPLAKHSLVSPRDGSKTATRESICIEHCTEPLALYCLTCKIALCQQCLSDNRHQSHEIQSIAIICKSQKTELSHNLQQLSEKARSTTEFIQRLKGMSDKVTESSSEFHQMVAMQCESLIQMIRQRRDYLLETIGLDKEHKLRILKEQQINCTAKLQQTTGLIQFCIETLKETDNATFLQVGTGLINRVADTDVRWHQEVTNAAPRVSPTIDLTLDDLSVKRAIDNLNFIKIKSGRDCDERLQTVPSTPTIIHEECSTVNNSVTVAWKAFNPMSSDGYVLELDDGSGGEFREVFCGKETICTVDGLHFNSMYNARVKAFNSFCEGEYSKMIGLHTAEVAWFAFDPALSDANSSGLAVSNDLSTVSVDGWEHQVALGSVGFSRGVHYWEFTVNKYTGDTDPAFGIARIDVARDRMLGKDDKGFAMYIDHKRSWFQHNSVHERRVEGGISNGSAVGILLDLDRHTLSFLVNRMPQGSIAFRDLYGVFYPAVSLNRGTTLTLHAGLPAPHIDCLH